MAAQGETRNREAAMEVLTNLANPHAETELVLPMSKRWFSQYSCHDFRIDYEGFPPYETPRIPYISNTPDKYGYTHTKPSCPVCRPQYFPVMEKPDLVRLGVYMKHTLLPSITVQSDNPASCCNVYTLIKQKYWEAICKRYPERFRVSDEDKRSVAALDRICLAWAYEHWKSITVETRYKLLVHLGQQYPVGCERFTLSKMVPSVFHHPDEFESSFLARTFKKFGVNKSEDLTLEGLEYWVKEVSRFNATYFFPGLERETLSQHLGLLPAIAAKIDFLCDNLPYNFAPLAQLFHQPAELAHRHTWFRGLYNKAMITMDGRPWAKANWGEFLPWSRPDVHDKSAAGFAIAWILMHMCRHVWQVGMMFYHALVLDLIWKDNEAEEEAKKKAQGKPEEEDDEEAKKKAEEEASKRVRQMVKDVGHDEMGLFLLKDVARLPEEGRSRTEIVSPYLWLVYARRRDRYREFYTNFKHDFFFTTGPSGVRKPSPCMPPPPGASAANNWGWDDWLRDKVPVAFQTLKGRDHMQAYIKRVAEYQPTYARNQAAKILGLLRKISTFGRVEIGGPIRGPLANRPRRTFIGHENMDPPKSATETDFSRGDKVQLDRAFQEAVNALMALITVHIAWLRQELPNEYFTGPNQVGGFLDDPTMEDSLDNLPRRIATLGRVSHAKADIFTEIREIWNHVDRARLDTSFMVRIRLDEIWFLLYHLHDWLMEPDLDRDPIGQTTTGQKAYKRKCKDMLDSSNREVIETPQAEELRETLFSSSLDDEGTKKNEGDDDDDDDDELPGSPAEPTDKLDPSLPGSSSQPTDKSLYAQYLIGPRFNDKLNEERKQEIAARKASDRESAQERKTAEDRRVAKSLVVLKYRHYEIIKHMMNAAGHERDVSRHYKDWELAVKKTTLVSDPVPSGGSVYFVKNAPDALEKIRSRFAEWQKEVHAEEINTLTKKPETKKAEEKRQRSDEFKKQMEGAGSSSDKPETGGPSVEGQGETKDEKGKGKLLPEGTKPLSKKERRKKKAAQRKLDELVKPTSSTRVTYHKPHGHDKNNLKKGWIKHQGKKFKFKFGWRMSFFASNPADPGYKSDVDSSGSDTCSSYESNDEPDLVPEQSRHADDE